MIDEWDNRNSDLKLPLEKTTDNYAETKTRYPLRSAVKHFPTIKSAPLYTTCERAEIPFVLNPMNRPNYPISRFYCSMLS